VVFVATDVWTAASAPGVARGFDPLLVDMTRSYRVAETSPQAGLTVLVRR
jgi:hypothetical protein